MIHGILSSDNHNFHHSLIKNIDHFQVTFTIEIRSLMLYKNKNQITANYSNYKTR